MKLRLLAAAVLTAVLSFNMEMEATAGVPDLEAWTFGSTATRIENNSEWRLNFGAGVGIGPDYVGSDDFTTHVLPVIDVEWRGTWFLSTQRGLGLNLIRNRQTKAGPRLTWSAGRNASDSTDLSGMGDLKPSIEAGFFIQHFSGPWRFEGDIRHGLNASGHQGLLGSASLALAGRLSEHSNLLIGGSTTFANEEYMQANFGVTTAQAAAGRTAYSAGGGFRDITGFASIVYNISQNFYLTIDGQAQTLMGSASESSLTKESLQFFAGSTIGYRF